MNNKIVLLTILAMALFMVACSNQSAQISLELEQFEFGDVVNGVIATKEIAIKNNGGSPLIIKDISTSCGCTTATIESAKILPGEAGVLHIEFDSGAHGPDLTGLLMRQVFLMTNDPDSPEVKVEFTANVVK